METSALAADQIATLRDFVKAHPSPKGRDAEIYQPISNVTSGSVMDDIQEARRRLLSGESPEKIAMSMAEAVYPLIESIIEDSVQRGDLDSEEDSDLTEEGVDLYYECLVAREAERVLDEQEDEDGD